MEIGGLQKSTLIDYPGKIAATVFCLGCNFCCPWCYNPELVLPEKIKKQSLISEEKFFSFLKSRQGLLEGVVISGGEPTIHKDLPKFCKKIKKLGFLVKLDTNGSNPRMLKKLIENKLIDYIAMDVKAPKEKYGKVVGMLECWNDKMFKNIKKSTELLKEREVDYEFRTTIVLGLHIKKDIIQIAKEIGGNPSTGSGQGKYYLQNFRPEKTIDPKFEKIKSYPKEYLLEIQKVISPFFEVCEIR